MALKLRSNGANPSGKRPAKILSFCILSSNGANTVGQPPEKKAVRWGFKGHLGKLGPYFFQGSCFIVGKMIGILFMEKSSTACNVWTQDGLSPWGSDCSPPAAWEFVHLHFLCCNLFGTCSGCMGMCPPVWFVSASLSEWLCDSRPKCGSECGYCWRRVPPTKFFAWKGFRHGVLITVLMISHLRKDVELAVRRLYDSRPTC